MGLTIGNQSIHPNQAILTRSVSDSRDPRPSDITAHPGSPWWALPLGAGAYLVLSIMVWWNVWSSHPTSITTCGCGDSSLFTWFLSWPAYAISHGLNPLYSTAMFHPTGVNLLANTGEVGIGVVLAPVTWIFGPVATLNVALTLSPTLSALADLRPLAALGHLGTGSVCRRSALRVLALRIGQSHRRPPHDRLGCYPASRGGLSGRDPRAPEAPTGHDRDDPRAPGGCAVLHWHRAPHHHCGRRRHREWFSSASSAPESPKIAVA